MIQFEELSHSEWDDLGLPFDETRCDSCDTAVGPYLAVDEETGGDRPTWGVVWRASDGVEWFTPRLYCEDCAQTPVEGEWFTPSRGDGQTVGIIVGVSDGNVEYSYGGPDLTATIPEEAFFLHVLGSWESAPC